MMSDDGTGGAKADGRCGRWRGRVKMNRYIDK
jgi:hypothetical protein